MNEIWKDIQGYEGLYQVSNLGRVRSLAKMAGKSPRKETTKHSFPDKVGYIKTNLYKMGEHKQVYVHRLVAEAFIPNPENKPSVNHINGVKSDNKVCNLEWVTVSENTKHAFTHNLRISPKQCLTMIINPKTNDTVVFASKKAASLFLGCHHKYISSQFLKHKTKELLVKDMIVRDLS